MIIVLTNEHMHGYLFAWNVISFDNDFQNWCVCACVKASNLNPVKTHAFLILDN